MRRHAAAIAAREANATTSGQKVEHWVDQARHQRGRPLPRPPGYCSPPWAREGPATLVAKDQVIAAQAATISAQAQTIAALLATRVEAAGQERAPDSPGTPEPPTVAQHTVLGAWGRVRRWWRW